RWRAIHRGGIKVVLLNRGSAPARVDVTVCSGPLRDTGGLELWPVLDGRTYRPREALKVPQCMMAYSSPLLTPGDSTSYDTRWFRVVGPPGRYTLTVQGPRAGGSPTKVPIEVGN